MRVRREVLGHTHVENSLANVSDFSRPMQDLVTEYCWGASGAATALPRKTRSLINLAMLTALNRPHELAVHVRGAINNGVTEGEIQEVLHAGRDLRGRAGRARILPGRRVGPEGVGRWLSRAR